MKVTLSLLPILLWSACVTSDSIHANPDHEDYTGPDVKGYVQAGGGYYNPVIPRQRIEDIRYIMSLGLPPNARELYHPNYFLQRALQEYGLVPVFEDPYPRRTYRQNPYQQNNAYNPFIRNQGAVPRVAQNQHSAQPYGDPYPQGRH